MGHDAYDDAVRNRNYNPVCLDIPESIKQEAARHSTVLRSLESLHEQTMVVAAASNTKKAIKIAAYEDVLKELKHYLTTSGCYDSRKRELVNKIDKAMEMK